MSKKCDICGKGPIFGNAVSHSNKKTRRKWYPNIQAITILVKGIKKKVKACTSCIKTNKLEKTF
ncbi:MAG: 50S ribosomal protein L28 [Candidatus Margulisiibacteriota bacterium]|nr:MAG: 50S ribosomal protein L28 [Candidatus Margulisbacteria bacterium GWD2_39_127]OGI03236.1 MAG: 50S ribosomal protein L28 [Candidatus Margulisbacteria bacterium GWF2_38_17]OGI11259.1 MAG: 50S ribosomal protein L28 [Candidatus Margulisbacteria bacterium GWE2_39_32]PZM78522.1 MAG: 50S ribosomal protein L28 [Candidatus Margulisiibacteriota bacterium]HAR63913.1 50S ribosomal protein L28 [Candidatus Margulisiibacteriota bacterium]